MILQPWLYMLFVVVGGFHVLAILYAYWQSQIPNNGVESVDKTKQSIQLIEFDCPEHGPTNEQRYRYCANCVSKLPGESSVNRMYIAPVRRQIL